MLSVYALWLSDVESTLQLEPKSQLHAGRGRRRQACPDGLTPSVTSMAAMVMSFDPSFNLIVCEESAKVKGFAWKQAYGKKNLVDDIENRDKCQMSVKRINNIGQNERTFLTCLTKSRRY